MEIKKNLKQKNNKKKIILNRYGKEEELEEDPGKKVIYKSINSGTFRNTQGRIIRRRNVISIKKY